MTSHRSVIISKQCHVTSQWYVIISEHCNVTSQRYVIISEHCHVTSHRYDIISKHCKTTSHWYVWNYFYCFLASFSSKVTVGEHFYEFFSHECFAQLYKTMNFLYVLQHIKCKPGVSSLFFSCCATQRVRKLCEGGIDIRVKQLFCWVGVTF